MNKKTKSKISKKTSRLANLARRLPVKLMRRLAGKLARILAVKAGNSVISALKVTLQNSVKEESIQ